MLTRWSSHSKFWSEFY